MSDLVATSKATRRTRSWKQASAKWIRWIHIYVSMFSCAVVLFFSATGITLNHPSWFGGDQESVRESTGSLKVEWLGETVSKLEIVEHLRSEAGARGALKDFSVDDAQCIVAFRAPGYTADVFVDRATGKFDMVESSLGLIAIFNDLHKGRDSGAAWSWVIDVSAVLLIAVSTTGLLLLFYLNRHRRVGLITGAVGLVATVVFYLAFVPR